MGFGGAASMNVVMKNNRNLLQKRDKFKNTLSSKNEKVEFKSPNASRSKLLEIKNRMKEENRRRTIKLSLVFGFIFSMLLSILFYYL